ncbi:MAG TPA: hypothetical protein ENK18_27620 [Deltaproteobacteria bacterium]|nr:hypothetical protein [Deltaproteobacteria bacterium]
MDTPGLADRVDEIDWLSQETVVQHAMHDEIEHERRASHVLPPDNLTLPLPTKIVLHPGSFSISTLSVALTLLMIGLMILTLSVAGLLTGFGVGIALVGLML